MTDSGSSPDSSALVDAFHRVEQWIHRRSLRLLNLDSHEREAQVHLMLANRQRGVVEYWTFLLLSTSIATLGLAMDSTTVVIGAMLVSPLMGPIVEFAMGLVVGSPVLTVRSTIRIGGSVVAVILGAALITLVLPFREVTGEIATRTQPTLLDMALAVCVALAAALTTVKARSETNVVAAGAAIGIALVPPICVVGYGVGTADLEIARGASLLLVTNFFAIISVGAIFFYLLGYERVSVQAWDDEALAAAPADSAIRRALVALERVFGSRRSGVFRIALPALLLAVVAVPLYSGLVQVSWEARTRAAVSRILAQAAEETDFDVQWDVSGGQVRVRTYLVGSVQAADTLQARLATRIAAAAGVEPDVRVTPMPTYGALQRALEPGAGSPRAESPPGAELARVRQELASALAAAWPEDAYGPVASWHVRLADDGGVDLHIQHLGPAPDAGAGRLLAAALGPRLPQGFEVRFDPVDTVGIRVEVDGAPAWLAAVARGAELVREAEGDGVRLCVEIPDSARIGSDPRARAAADLALPLIAGLPAVGVALTPAGETFAVRVTASTSATSCGAVDAAEGEGESGDAASPSG
ncbi:MAG: DUF389 domain-containing protein [Longimicrobiales bacterium]